MPVKQQVNAPRCRRQKGRPCDRAFVELNGRRHYLGRWNTPESRQRYDRLIAQWLAGGRQLPVDPSDITIVELCAQYWEHAKGYYRDSDGKPTSTLAKCRAAVRALTSLYGPTAASKFGPLDLRAVREAMIEGGGKSRGVINEIISWIRNIFRWAAGRELIRVEIFTSLTTVEPLRQGRSKARETEAVRPVPEGFIEAVHAHLSRQVWAMIQIQILTGCRPDEVVRLRPVDFRCDGTVWTVTLDKHKNAWRGMSKIIYFGPRAQAIVHEFMADRPVDAYLFSPMEEETDRRAMMHAQRRTPPSYGNNIGTNRRKNPRRKPRNHYSVASYRKAIQRACEKAFPPRTNLIRVRVHGKRGLRWESKKAWRSRLGPEKWKELKAWAKVHWWPPNRLRHNAATNLRREFGLDVAQTILGHRLGSSVTEIYAEANIEKALNAVRRVG